MLGKLDEARANVELARAAVERNPGNAAIRDGYLGMQARYLLETERWEPAAATPTTQDTHAAHAAMPGMTMPQSGSTWLFLTGISAAKRGDAAAADAVAMELSAMHEKLIAGGDAYRAKTIQILTNEVAAAASLARGRMEQAVSHAQTAADVELTMSPPSGPPDPIKPALELYGETLLAANRPEDAMRVFERSLQRTPNRTPSLLGLARAAAKSGATAIARRAYTELAEMPGAAPAAPAVREARSWLASARE
jgi:tetratricopeptide (TPR) repeat protein